MTTDVTRYSFDELKHFLGVQLQAGRVQLDSDWNEQSEIFLRLLQRTTNDEVRTGSPNHGFRIDDRILLDTMDVCNEWTASVVGGGAAPQLSVDHFDFRTGDGSVVVEGADTLRRALRRTMDLTGLVDVLFAVKGTFAANACVFTLWSGGAPSPLPTTEVAGGLAGWRLFRALPTGIAPAVLAAVDAYGFTSLDAAQTYRFDFIKVDLPIRFPLVTTTDAAGFVATSPNVGDVPEVRIDDDDRIWRSLVLAIEDAATVSHDFEIVRDLRHVRRLIFAARSSVPGAPVYALRVVDATVAHNELVLAGSVVAGPAGWEVRAFDLPQAGVFDWSKVAGIKLTGLTTTTAYKFSPLLAEMSLVDNLVIMGGDGTSDGAGRFYGDGLAAVKERHETYFSQIDLPEADPSAIAAPAADQARADIAYLDLWERPVSFIEHPPMREVALEGPDTCTRTQLVAQVRLLAGAILAGPGDPTPPDAAFDALPRCGSGVLTTKDLPAAVLDPCADPCEPRVLGTFVGQENRLYRVEIHTAGGIGAAGAAGTATFKWSSENAAVATPLLETAPLGSFTAVVETPELFAEDDLIEIRDDLADLITGPYTTRTQTRGELRRITGVDVQARTVSWEDAGGALDPALHAALPRAYRVAYHAKIRRWSGVLPATPGDIVLGDGVVIELGGSAMLPGDYWTFVTRVVERSVERLIEAPPRGSCHRYFKLAYIRRRNAAGTQSIVIDDLRPRFRPLTRLAATNVTFDPCECEVDDPQWGTVKNVQQAIDTLCRIEQDNDMRLHNKLLHGHGVVCGLKVKCDPNRRHVIVEPGYALDCEGRGIRVRSNQVYNLVDDAIAAGLLDGTGTGSVCLRIATGIAQDATFTVEEVIPQSFWQGVLEGTLIKDFYDHCIKTIFTFFKNEFLPFPDDTVPASTKDKLTIAVLNLIWQFVNPTNGRYVFLSKAEHDLLSDLYALLKLLLSSETFCAMFDNDTPFPAYPYGLAPGIDTSFGLFKFHRRVRLHPNGQFAYTCLGGNTILVHDLTTLQVVQLLEFPGGTNAEVQDIAFNDTGSEMYVVATLNNTDSVFATVTIGAGQTHTWGPTTITCDLLFVSLATSAAHPNTLYALAKSVGLYAFNPAAIPLTPGAPSPAPMAFNATGLLCASVDGHWIFAAERSAVATPSLTYDRIRRIDLNGLANAPVFLNVPGTDADNDIVEAANVVYVTGDTSGAVVKPLRTFSSSTGVEISTAIDLGDSTPTRLVVLTTTNPPLLLATQADRNRVVRVNLATRTLDTRYRIPVQIFPMGITKRADESELYVLNYVSNTLSVVDTAMVVTALAPPPFTDEPPITLSAYRQQIIDAFGDLLSHFLQSLKDCFCDQFLIDCEDCRKDPNVYLGVVEVHNNQIYHICNFSKRHYVKTFRTYGYWLSTIPILPIVKQLVKKFCCTIF